MRCAHCSEFLSPEATKGRVGRWQLLQQQHGQLYPLCAGRAPVTHHTLPATWALALTGKATGLIIVIPQAITVEVYTLPVCFYLCSWIKHLFLSRKIRKICKWFLICSYWPLNGYNAYLAGLDCTHDRGTATLCGYKYSSESHPNDTKWISNNKAFSRDQNGRKGSLPFLKKWKQERSTSATNSTVHVHVTWSSNDQFPDTNPEPKPSVQISIMALCEGKLETERRLRAVGHTVSEK